jgi:DNA end-binding protein Ku
MFLIINTDKRRSSNVIVATHQIWTGSISFGLVTVPVKLYSATEDKEISFNQLCPNGHRIKYKRWCTVEEKEIPYSEIKKGYKLDKNNYVVLEKSDLDKLKLKTTKSIDIKEFVDSTELDPILIERSYYVAPDTKRGNDKAYSLLVKTMSDTKKIAIGKIILRDKEDIVALRPYQRAMVMHILKYLDEIKPPDEIPDIREASKQKTKFESEEISLAKTLVDKFTSKALDLSDYSDTYAKEIKRLIDAKSKGKTIVVKPEPKQKIAPDLLEALKASMQVKKTKS